MNITVLGAGAWGTAIAIALAHQHPVVLWGREADRMQEIQKTRENKIGLPGFHLPDALQVSADLENALAHVQQENGLLLVATSVAGLRSVTRLMQGKQIPNLIWLCKGFEEVTGAMPHQIVAEELSPDVPYGVLSGPSFAQEVAAKLPCALTIASDSMWLRQQMIQAVNGSNMRVYASEDVIGVEVGGAIKNILAIAAGMADGMKLGMNARAALMTRGLAEMTRLGIALGGRTETFMGLTGIGDLILTCTGDLSRNRRIGLALAEGKALHQIVADLGHVAEGVRCASVVRDMAVALGVDMPITHAVAGVLFEGISLEKTLSSLLSRTMRDEVEPFNRVHHLNH